MSDEDGIWERDEGEMAQADAPEPSLVADVETSDGARLVAYVYSPEGVEDTPLTPHAILRETPPVLMLHGNGEDHHDFDPIIGAVAANVSVICFDARGQGASGRGTEPLTYELLARDAFRVLDSLGISLAHVVGFSDGGIEALVMAATCPARVVSLVCLGANIWPEGLTDDTRAGIAMTERMCAGAAGRDRRAARTAELMRLMLDEPHIDPASLGAIACPTWIMCGTHDVVRPEHTELIASSIPGALTYVVDGAGHDLVGEAPEQVLECLFDAARRGEDEMARKADQQEEPWATRSSRATSTRPSSRSRGSSRR